MASHALSSSPLGDVWYRVQALKSYGFPVGPMSLVDEVGIDVAASVGKNLKGDLKNRISADPAMMDEVVAKGILGRKSGAGMFMYPGGKVMSRGQRRLA